MKNFSVLVLCLHILVIAIIMFITSDSNLLGYCCTSNLPELAQEILIAQKIETLLPSAWWWRCLPKHH